MKKLHILVAAVLLTCGIAIAADQYAPRGYSVGPTSTLILPNANPAVTNVWVASASVSLGDYIRVYRTNGSYGYYWCVTAGTSSNAVPTFVTNADVTDLAVTWRYVNPERGYMSVQNDGSGVVYLSFGDNAAVASTGTRLNASGGSLVRGNGQFQGEVRAISAASTTNTVLVQELPK